MSKVEGEFNYVDEEEDEAPLRETQPGDDFSDDEEKKQEEEELNDEDIKEIFGSDSDEDETEETLFGDVKKIKVPKFDKPQKNTKLIFFKLPSTLSIQKKQFTPENLKEEIGKTKNVIRWRRREGHPDESNARIIHWDDGSIQLKVGETYFDISEQTMSKNHLYISSDDVLVQQGEINDKWVLKPHSLKDATLSSFKIASKENKRKTKTTTTQTPIIKDDRYIAIESAKLQSKQNRALEKSDAYQYSDLKFKRKRKSEEEEYEAEKRISNLKKSVPQVKRKKRNSTVEDQELDEEFLEDDSEEEVGEHSEEEEEEEDYNSEDDEEDYFDE
eukprot:gene5753-9574_t